MPWKINIIIGIVALLLLSPTLAAAYGGGCNGKCKERRVEAHRVFIESKRFKCEEANWVKTGQYYKFVEKYGCLNDEQYKRYLKRENHDE